MNQYIVTQGGSIINPAHYHITQDKRDKTIRGFSVHRNWESITMYEAPDDECFNMAWEMIVKFLGEQENTLLVLESRKYNVRRGKNTVNEG